MGLEALELLEWVQIGICIVEVNDKADRHQIVAEMIEKRSTAGAAIERPAERVLYQSGPMFIRRDLPELLEPDAVFLRFAILFKTKPFEQRLGEAAARAFGEQRVFCLQLHPARERSFPLALLADAHVAGGNTNDRAFLRVEHLGRRKAWKDLDTERLRLGGEPAADIAERHDKIAMIAHEWRHQNVRQPDR